MAKYPTSGGTGGNVVDASDTVKGITKLSVAPAVAANPVAVGDNDARNTNARTPTAHAASHGTGSTDPVTIAEAQVTGLVADLAAKDTALAAEATARAAADTAEATARAAADALKAQGLIATAVKTANYAAAAADFVPVDISGGSVTVTLPTAPADRTRIGVKIIATGGANTLTVARGGTDVLNKAGGSTSLTLSFLNQAAILQYDAGTGIWYVQSTDAPISSLTIAESQVTNLVADLAAKDTALAAEATTRANADALLAPKASPALTGTPTVPTAAPATNTTQAASTAYVDAAASTVGAPNTQTGDYTLVLADAGKSVEINAAITKTVTVPPNSSVAFAIGTIIEVLRYGAGAVNIAAGIGVTIRSNAAKLGIGHQYASVSLRQRATDEWVLVGDLA